MAQDLPAGALASQQAAVPCAHSAGIQPPSAMPEVVGLPHGGHTRWVRLSHWIVAASVLTLAVSGFVILMAHPRLYWGVAGNDLTPALFELPISRNYRHGGWDKGVAFFGQTAAPVSASRTYDIFNQNSWGRSLHFLAGWFLALTGTAYLVAGVYTGHFRRHLLPGTDERAGKRVWQDLVSHLQFKFPPTTGGPPYGILQKWSYAGVVFLALPLMIVTGLAMSPAITVAYPFLSNMFGGSQSARTIHFFAFAALTLFLVVHVLMVVLSGFRRQMRAMTLGT
jgi:thiosulfate reductase cytochrome b subunit